MKNVITVQRHLLSWDSLLLAKGNIAQANWPYNDADVIHSSMQHNNSSNLMMS